MKYVQMIRRTQNSLARVKLPAKSIPSRQKYAAKATPPARPTHPPYSRPRNLRQGQPEQGLHEPWQDRLRSGLTASLARSWEHRYAITSQLLFYGLNCVLICHVIWNNLCSVNGCYGPSMLPTLNVQGDWVLISKLHARGRGVAVGDLVSYEHPVRPGTSAIKRVMGMPGDFVLRDTPGRGGGVMVQVPQNHCWVMGDNIDWTRDSRHFGALPLALVRGKVVARVLPWRQFKLLGGEFEDFEEIVDDPV